MFYRDLLVGHYARTKVAEVEWVALLRGQGRGQHGVTYTSLPNRSVYTRRVFLAMLSLQCNIRRLDM